MRLKETAAIAVAILLLPILAAHASAQRPSGFEPIPEYEFIPVPVVEDTMAEAAIIPEVTARPEPQVIIDTFNIPPRPTARPAVVQPTPRSITVFVPPKGQTATGPSGRHRISGKASYYCGNGSRCPKGYGPGYSGAAAGPALRIAMGGAASSTAPQPWRGKTVTVCKTGTSTCVRVTLVDWCQCYWKQSHEKVIDLFYAPFKTVGGSVTISW